MADPRDSAPLPGLRDDPSWDWFTPENAWVEEVTRRMNGQASALAQPQVRGYDELGALLVGNSRPMSLGAVGDSTTSPWFGPFIDWLAPRLSHRTVSKRVWNDTKQQYSDPSVLQYGLDGDRWVGTSLTGPGLRANVAHNADQNNAIIDARVKVSLPSMTPGIQIPLIGKCGNAGNRGWWLQVEMSGNLTFTTSPDGTNIFTVSSGIQLASLAPTIAANVPFWARVTFDSATRAVNFYTSLDGVTWTLFAGPTAVGGVGPTFPSTYSFQAIGRTDSANGELGTKLYAARLLVGSAAIPVVDIDMDMLPHVGNTFTDHCGRMVEIRGKAESITDFTRGGALGLAVYDGSLGGSSISYAADPTRFAKQIPIAVDYGLINYGHTGGTDTAEQYLVPYATIVDAYLAKSPYAMLVGSIENPQASPRTQSQIDAHAARQQGIKSYMIGRGFSVIDAYAAFVKFSADTSTPMTTLVPDGVHPSAGGYTLWGDISKRSFGAIT